MRSLLTSSARNGEYNIREGYDMVFGGTYLGSAGSLISTGFTTPPPGHSYVITSIILSTDVPCVFYVRLLESVAGASSVPLTLMQSFITGTAVIPCNILCPAGHSINITAGQSNVGAHLNATAIKASGTIFATRITSDFNYTASNVIQWVGDSITENSSCSLTTRDCYQFQTRDYIILDTEKSWRLNIYAQGGKSGVTFDTFLANEGMYVDNPSLIFYQHGVNDSSQTVGETAYKLALNNYIRYKQIHYPNAILVMLGATPVQDNTRETALATYRTYMSDVVTAAADDKVFYISLASAFDRTDAANFASADTPGDKIHPSSLVAHNGIRAAIMTGITTNGIVL